MTRTLIANKAREFMIWREGKSVNWDCTIADLSRVTGISPGTVRRIVRERKWPVRNGKGKGKVATVHVHDVLALLRGAEFIYLPRNLYPETD